MSYRSGSQWTPEEDEILLRMLANGKGPTAISKVLDRTFEAVQGRRRTIKGTWGPEDRKVPPPPVGVRVQQLVATIERRREDKKPDADLLREYRTGLLILRARERGV